MMQNELVRDAVNLKYATLRFHEVCSCSDPCQSRVSNGESIERRAVALKLNINKNKVVQYVNAKVVRARSRDMRELTDHMTLPYRYIFVTLVGIDGLSVLVSMHLQHYYLKDRYIDKI